MQKTEKRNIQNSLSLHQTLLTMTVVPNPLEKPQIVTHCSKSLAYTAYDVRWVPSSARFVILGQLPRGSGVLEVCQLSNGSITKISEVCP